MKREVVAGELVGTWRLTPVGVAGLGAGGHEVNPEDHSLVVRADGSCAISMFKESCVQPGRPDPGMISSAEPCRWSLRQAGGNHEVVFDIPDQRRALEITEEEGKLLIFEIVCDPDSWKYAEYEKGGGA